MRVLGQFGDTHVTPGVLFAPNDGWAQPPLGSIDVQFRVPVSLSLLLDALGVAERRSDVDAWVAAYRDLAVDLMTSVQHAGGYALRSSDTAVPARLNLAVTVDEVVPGFGTRWHCHVWVGPTARMLADEEPRPVAVEALIGGIHELVWPRYIRSLEELSQRQLGVRWGEPQPGAVREIVEPPWHEHVGPADRGICPGPRRTASHRVLADAQDLSLAADTEVYHARAVRDGSVDDAEIDPRVAREGLMRGLMSAGDDRASADYTAGR